MKIRFNLLVLIVFAAIIDITAQTNPPKSIIEIQNDPLINKQTLALTNLIDDIRRAVLGESENELKECLPPFTKTSINSAKALMKGKVVSSSIYFFLKLTQKEKRTNK